MKPNLLPLNLQLFADPPADPPAEPPAAPSFDDLLKDKAHQAEFDRRVTKALETAKAKWTEESEAKIAEAKTEAEKLARMTLEQKAAHEREQQEKALKDREALRAGAFFSMSFQKLRLPPVLLPVCKTFLLPPSPEMQNPLISQGVFWWD